jgi:hypothetical protein
LEFASAKFYNKRRYIEEVIFWSVEWEKKREIVDFLLENKKWNLHFQYFDSESSKLVKTQIEAYNLENDQWFFTLERLFESIQKKNEILQYGINILIEA